MNKHITSVFVWAQKRRLQSSDPLEVSVGKLQAIKNK